MRSSIIAHIDMDAFFAAVEQRDHPELLGKPVVVGADPKKGRGRGVVSTASYEARVYGIHSAMPISKAYRLCPHAVFLPGSMKKYSKVSNQIFDIFYDFTPEIEPISVDEAFLDLTGSFHFYKTPYNTCVALKERIKKETRLTASVGIAPVKMAAKIASDLCKPDGLLEIKEGGLLDFLWPLKIEKLWGVGPKTKETLNRMKIETIGDIARTPLEILRNRFGENGEHLYSLANGIDPRQVVLEEEAKSVSNEHTFERDTADKDEIYRTLLYLSEKVSRRLRKDNLKGKTLTVKIRLADFKTYTRAFTYPERTNFTDTIYRKAKEVFDGFYKSGMKVRLLGVRLSHFNDPYVQENLFEDEKNVRLEKIHRAVDSVKNRFGEDAIRHGFPKSID